MTESLYSKISLYLDPSATSLLIVLFALPVGAIIGWFFVAKQFEKIATRKGHNPKNVHAFAMVFWLSIIGIIYVLALPDLVAQKQREQTLQAMQNMRQQNEANNANPPSDPFNQP